MDDRFLREAVDSCLKKGVEARERGDYALARAQLLQAVQGLKKLADNCTGLLRTTRLEQASKILDAIEAMDNTSPLTRQTKGSSTQKRELDSSETVWKSVQIPHDTFADIAGLDDVKKASQDMIIDIFKYEDIYKKYKYEGGGGILMCGLPGNGKTAIARAIAGEARCKFFSVKPSDIKSKWQGESVKNIKNLFAVAREEERAIIFFDDIDPLAKDRALLQDNSSNEILNELLMQMEGFERYDTKLLVLGATNIPWDLDSAMYSRFKQIINVPMPDFEARMFIIKRELSGIPTEENFDIAQIADKTEDYSGRDVVSLCYYARSLPLRRDKENVSQGLPADSVITNLDIEQALQKIKPSIGEKDKLKMQAYLSQYKHMLL